MRNRHLHRLFTILTFLFTTTFGPTQLALADDDPFAEVMAAFAEFQSAVSATTELAEDFKAELDELQTRTMAIRRFLILNVDAIILGDALDIAIVETDNVLVRKMNTFATLYAQQQDRAAELTAKIRDLFLEERIENEDIEKHTTALNIIAAQLEAFKVFTARLRSDLPDLRDALAATRELVEVGRYHGALRYMVRVTVRIRDISPRGATLLEKISIMNEQVIIIEQLLDAARMVDSHTIALRADSVASTSEFSLYDPYGRLVARGVGSHSRSPVTSVVGASSVLANGVYLMITTFRDKRGTSIGKEIKKIIKLH
jgi:hypothetical protein